MLPVKIAAWLGLTAEDATLLLSGAMVFVTAVLVIVTGIYAGLTFLLVRATRRQAGPYIHIEPVRPDPTQSTVLQAALKLELSAVLGITSLELKNAGPRSAQDVRIQTKCDAHVWTFTPPQSTRVVFSTVAAVADGVPYLAPGERCGLGLVFFFGAGEPQRLEFVVTYRDGSGLKYREKHWTTYRA